MRLLFMAKGSFDSGNYVTMTRIMNNMKLLDKNIITTYHNLNVNFKFMEIYDFFKPDIIVTLNIMRSVFLLDYLNEETQIILILGGTDINMIYENEFMKQMEQLLMRSRCVVAFSKEMIHTFKQKFPNIQNKISIKIIPQGIPDIIVPASIKEEFKEIVNYVGSHYFIIAGRLRDVKDPSFAINPFIEWQSIACNSKYRLVYIGNVEEESESIKEFLENIKNYKSIKHYSSLPQSDLFYLMKHSCALINCSLNEGQSTTILEAMKIGVLVIARKVVGNMDLIEDNHTGYLFSSKRELVEAFEKVKDSDKIEKIISNAENYVLKNHNEINENEAYMEIIR